MASGTGIGEFFISLTVDAAQGALTVGDLVAGMGKLEVATLAEIGLLYEMAVMLARVTDEGIRASLGFTQFTMHTGLSAQELQKWQIVAQQSHATAEEVSQTVEGLTKHLANLAIGIPDSSLASLQQLGISAFDASGKMKDAFQILGEVRARLGVVTQDAGQQERILAGLGISPNLRETLLLSRELFDRRASFVPGMSAEQQGQFDRLRQTFVEIELLAKQIGIDIGAWISGPLAKVLGLLEIPLRELPAWEKKGWQAWGDAFDRAQAADARAKAAGKSGLDFKDSVLGQLIFGVEPRGVTPNLQMDAASLIAPSAAGVGPSGPRVLIDKHDVYHIQTNDPNAMKAAIEEHWDQTLQKKTIDGFDRQLGNGGY